MVAQPMANPSCAGSSTARKSARRFLPYDNPLMVEMANTERRWCEVKITFQSCFPAIRRCSADES